MSNNKALYNFSDEYKEMCFYAWYENRSLPRQKMLDAMPPDPNGKRPAFSTVIHWRDAFGWIERADALDADVSREVEQTLVKKTAERYEKLALVGEEVLQLARDYLKSQGFDSAASAVRAIGLGGEMITKYAGMADKISALSSMTPAQLESLAQKLLGQQEKDENVITSYAESVPDESEPDDDSTEQE